MKRIIGLLMLMGLMVGVGCGGDSDSPTGPSNEVTKGPDGQTLEIKTEEWDNGNIKVEFQFYRDGGSVVKHGFYKEYDEDGTLRVDGTYFEDKEKYNGKWIKYYSDGQIKSEENFVEGKAEGKWVWYFEGGAVKREENYVDDKLEGKFIYYHDDGSIEEEYCYKNGEKVDMSKCE